MPHWSHFTDVGGSEYQPQGPVLCIEHKTGKRLSQLKLHYLSMTAKAESVPTLQTMTRPASSPVLLPQPAPPSPWNISEPQWLTASAGGKSLSWLYFLLVLFPDALTESNSLLEKMQNTK